MIDSGDTAWVLLSTLLVFSMSTPGLAIYFGGMAQKKNVVSTVIQCTAVSGIVTLAFLLFGYSLSMSPDHGNRAYDEVNPFNGDYGEIWFHGLRYNAVHLGAPTIPQSVHAMFQLSFAIITAVLVTGCFEGRAQFGQLLLFIVLWNILVYSPIAYWNWHPDGFLFRFGVLDFAGGNVVHISSGWSGFIGTLTIGNRKKFSKQNLVPHNILMVIMGVSMLWIGWFGFNGGSAFSAGNNAGMAVLSTQLSASIGMIGWIFCERVCEGRYTVLGVTKGILCGLIAVTPASGYIDSNGAVCIGFISSLACYGASLMKVKYNIDDYYDAFGLHVVGGVMGGILVAFFARKEICGDSDRCVDGIVYGTGNDGWELLYKQLVGVVMTSAWSLVMTYLLIIVIEKVFGFRVSEEDELLGLDAKLHGNAIEEKLEVQERDGIEEVPEHHKVFYNLRALDNVQTSTDSMHLTRAD